MPETRKRAARGGARRVSPHATAGVQPTMAIHQNTRDPEDGGNGHDIGLIPVSKVKQAIRAWGLISPLLSTFVLAIAFMAHTEWLSVPAKSVELKALTAIVTTQGETLKRQVETSESLALAIARLEATSTAQAKYLERIEGKLDRLLERPVAKAEAKSPRQVIVKRSLF